MKSNRLISTILATLLCLTGVSQQARAQQPVSGSSKTDGSAEASSGVDLSTLLARVWRGRPAGFSLMPSGRYRSLTAAATVSAQNPQDNYTGPKIRIAVMNLSGSALNSVTTAHSTTNTTTIALPPPSDFARGLTEMLTTALVKTGRFVVLERTAIDRVTGEQDFGESGRVNPETAPAKGRIIAAQTLINGDITEFSYEQSSFGGKASPIGQLAAKADKVTAIVALDIRLLDAVTGEVIFSQRSKGKASMSGVAADFAYLDKSLSVASQQNTPLGKASREALEGSVAAIVAGLKKVPWSGRIIDVREDRVYINAGSEAGIQSGMQFDVYEPQLALVDPETGKALGTPDRRIGAVTVEAVEDKYSVARVTDGSTFKRNNLVRFKGQPQKP